jgi:hypothetical protein
MLPALGVVATFVNPLLYMAVQHEHLQSQVEPGRRWSVTDQAGYA